LDTVCKETPASWATETMEALFLSIICIPENLFDLLLGNHCLLESQEYAATVHP